MKHREILQHYPQTLHKEVIDIINSFTNVSLNYAIKDFGFIDPPLQQIINEMSSKYPNVIVHSNGGYEESERKKVILYPDYLASITDDVVCVNVEYKVYQELLQHPQVMGTLYNSGFEANKIGDIIVCEKGEVQFVCDKTLYDYLSLTPLKIAKYRVLLKEIPTITIEIPQLAVSHFTVNSLRLDVIVKNIIRKSRGRAEELISQKNVRVNHIEVKKMTTIIKEGDLISIKGYNRYRIIKIEPTTKKLLVTYEYHK